MRSVDRVNPWLASKRCLWAPGLGFYSRCMVRLRTAAIILALLALAGCGSRPDRSDEMSGIQTLSVSPSISGNITDLTFRLEGSLQSAVARALVAKGYLVGPEGDAQGTVRVAWILGRDVTPSGQEERTLALSLSVFSRSGERLYSVRSLQAWPESLWSESRMLGEVSRMLRDLPEARKAAQVPVDGKPALAPIRLK